LQRQQQAQVTEMNYFAVSLDDVVRNVNSFVDDG
jgi:hypothetical protein